MAPNDKFAIDENDAFVVIRPCYEIDGEMAERIVQEIERVYADCAVRPVILDVCKAGISGHLMFVLRKVRTLDPAQARFGLALGDGWSARNILRLDMLDNVVRAEASVAEIHERLSETPE